MRDRIKVLFVAADPFRDLARLELEDEMRAIRRALAQGKAHDTLELEACFGTRTRDLQLALLEYQPQIVHFSGHGDGDGVIYLSDAAGRPAAVGKAALAGLFDLLESEVRVVVLNACNTYTIVEALRDMVDYAIGTNREVTDRTAITFSQAFYTALASGAGVQKAYDMAVNQLELDGSDEAAVPLIRKRFGADRRPLLEVPAAPGVGATPADGGKVFQEADLGHVAADRATIVGADQQGPAAGPRDVVQRIKADGVSGGEFTLIGSRTDTRGRGAE